MRKKAITLKSTFLSMPLHSETNVHSVPVYTMATISLKLTDRSWSTGHSRDSCTSCVYWFYYRPWADKTQLPALNFLLFGTLQHAQSGGVKGRQKERSRRKNGRDNSRRPFPPDSSSYYCHDRTFETKQQQRLPSVCLLRFIIWAKWWT